ncbi:glycoside hydrolase [Achlya hypogyna]|uniref:Glycoside hydrolase n=1 Tax=Achlya hypogyna TaxID=1202772 RepID=A0A1V9Z688_ACHHY|nr:glycoside hydrolase [Achlya hypogyna]
MEIGSRVLVVGGKTGIVRFLGTTEFAQGDWVGVELDGPDGKNDGEINGVRYFQCEPNYGLFAKKSQVRLARGGSTPPQTQSTPTTSATSRLLQMREKRSSTSSLGGSAAPPAPVVKKTSPRLATDGTRTTPLTRRSSLTVPSSPSRRPPAPAPISVPPSPTGSTRSTRSIRSIDDHDALEHAHDKIENLLHDLEHKNERIAALESELEAAKETPATLDVATPTDANADAKAEYEDKIRDLRDEGIALAAKMRKDYEIKITKLEKQWEDKEAAWAAGHEKQTTELHTAHAELVALRSRMAQFTAAEQSRTDDVAQAQAKAAAAGRKVTSLEAQLAELHDTVELLTLEKETLAMDKEIAEERLEDAEMEVEKLKLAAEIAADPGTLHLDVHSTSVHEENAKLRTAIKALHDRYADEKLELTKALKEATRQATELARYRDEVEVITAKMAATTHENDELKEMLDVASAYEAMVEALTEKNLALGERVADLEASVASLEALKDMGEEMEHQHEMLEKELRSELKALRAKTAEQAERLQSTQASLDDKERTVHRFRELAHRNREEMAALREKLRLEAGELESMKDTTHAVLSQTLNLRQALAAARASTVEAAQAKVAADAARVEATWLRALLPSAVFGDADDRALRGRLLLARVDGKLTVVLDHVRKNLASLTSEVLANALEKARLGFEWRLGVDMLRLRVNVAGVRHALATAADAPFHALLARVDAPATHTLDTALDAVLAALAADGGLGAGSDSHPSAGDRLKATAADWSALFPSTGALSAAGVVKIAAQADAATISLRCACVFLQDELPLDLRGAVWNLALQVARRADIDLGSSDDDGDDGGVVGGDVLTQLRAYADESGTLATETQLLSFKERLAALYKTVAKGGLTDACAPTPGKRRQPVWELRAEQIRGELANAASLLQSLEETTEVCHTLQSRLKELEKSESQSRVIVQKLEHDVARLTEAVAVEAAASAKLGAQLTQERVQFDQMLTEQNKERAVLEAANRQLRKQMRRTSDLAVPKTTDAPATAPAHVRALEAALASMHGAMQRLREDAARDRLQAATAPLAAPKPPTAVAACLADARRLESQLLAQASLPQLYAVGSPTPIAATPAVPLAKAVAELRSRVTATAVAEQWGDAMGDALAADEVHFAGRSIDPVPPPTPQCIGRLRVRKGAADVVKVVLSSRELRLLSQALT